MSNPSTTYTMLVTIAHDAGAAPSRELLESMIERGLEEGVREFAGVHAATVSAIEGDHLKLAAINAKRTALDERLLGAHTLHAALRF